MRYLKRFNESNSYYEEITITDFFDLDIINIEDKYLDMLKKYNIKHDIRLQRGKSTFIIGTLNLKFKTAQERMDSLKKHPGYFKEIEIWELRDEWFIVNINDLSIAQEIYYKCDQWSGVIDLLKDNRII